MSPDNTFLIHPFINACLNMLSATFMIAAVISVKKGNRALHEKLMFAAVGCSMAFLISYLIRKFTAGDTPYQGTGIWRYVYFGILIPHVSLALTVPFGVGRAIFLAKKERFVEHRKFVRKFFPIWCFVSVTGVIVYLFLFHFPGQG